MQLDKKTQYTSKEQELLLQAALLDGEHAINAWREWRNMVDLEGHADYESYRLFPLLYKNLERLGVNDLFMKRLKGIYRMEWYKKQSFFYEMSKVIRYLHDAGIQVMIMKGAALKVLYYKNNAACPIADLGILVPASQAPSTINLLTKADWIITSNLLDDSLCFQHSMQFNDQSGKELNLYWTLLFGSCLGDFDADFWDRAVPIKLNEVSTYTLNPTDTLFHVIVQGVRLNPEPPIRWIADAMSIINSSDIEIDWPRLIIQAKNRLLVLRVKDALNYLYENFYAPIPNSILKKINQLPISRIESLEYRIGTKNPETISNILLDILLGAFPQYLVEYLRLTNGAGLLRKIIGWPKYLQYRLDAKSLHALFFSLISRHIRVMTNKLSPRLCVNNSK